ncbi:MAG: CNNM domain-containing protein [Candidatus Omnitrophota bacterium]
MSYLYLLGCFCFVVLQGFFSASEISFVSCRPLSLRHRQNKGDKKAKRVYEFIMKPEEFLITTLVGTNIAVVLSSSFLTFFLIDKGVQSGNLWTTFVFAPVIVIFAELIPKNIGRFFRESFSCRTIGFIDFFKNLLFPVIKSIEVVNKTLAGIFLKKARHRSPFVTKEEIKFMVQEIESQGGIDKGEKKAIEEVFEFRSDKIGDICLEAKKISAIDYEDSYEVVIETIKRCGFTRYPVFSAKGACLPARQGSASEGKDREPRGYINAYDLFFEDSKNWQNFIRPIAKVGLNQKLQDIFTRLKSQKESIALVFKGKKIYGMITMEDIVREIMTAIVKA